MSRLRWILPLLAVTALAAFFRLHRLDSIPPGLFGDEAANALVAAEIRRGERLPIYIEEASKWGSREPLYAYLVAGVFAVAGESPATLRLASVLLGILTVSLFFLLCRRHLGGRVAIFAAVLLASSTWHVTASRIGLRAVLGPLWVVLTLLAASTLWRRPGAVRAAALGLTVGAGFYTYPAYWVVPPLLVAAAAWSAIPAGREQTRDLRGPLPSPSLLRGAKLAAVAVVAALLAAAPLIRYAAARPDYFFGRARRTLTAPPDEAGFSLRDNALKVLLMLHFRGDRNARHGRPGRAELDPLTGLLFLVGLWWTLRRLLSVRRRRGERCLLLAAWLVPLLPSAATDSAPHALRALGAAPAVCAIGAIGLDRVSAWLGRISRGAARAAVLAALAAVVAFGHHAYFREWGRSPTVAAAFNADFIEFYEYLADLAGRADVWVSPYVYGAPQVRFLNLARRAPLRAFEDASPLRRGQGGGDRIVVSDSAEVNVLVRDLYPDVQVIARYAVQGRSSGRIFRLESSRLLERLPPAHRRAIDEALRAARDGAGGP